MPRFHTLFTAVGLLGCAFPLSAAIVHEATVAPGVPGEPEGNDLFGQSVALDGDTLAVGAFSDDLVLVPGEGEVGNVGSVSIFVRNGNGWQLQQRITPPQGEANAWFGWDVDLDGDRVLIGAPAQDSPAAGGGPLLTDQGAAYVYRRDGTIWTLEHSFTPTLSLGAMSRYGAAVALDGDSVLIGAPDFGGGIVDVFHLDTPNVWSFEQRLSATTPFPGPNAFGRALDVSAGTAMVGAPTEDGNGLAIPDAGAAYVFRRDNGVWTQQARWLANPIQSGAAFGEAVAIDGDRALVGARDESVAALSAAGAVYAFQRTAGQWNATQRITAAVPANSARFGNSVAVTGARAAIGSYWASGDSGAQQGQISLWQDDVGGWSMTHTVRSPPAVAAAYNQFGVDVAMSNARIAVGESGADGSSYNAGRAHVFRDDPSALFGDGFE